MRPENFLIKHQVVNRTSCLKERLSLDVRVGRHEGRLPTAIQLEAVSSYLRQQSPEFKNMFVCFYLPDMELDSGCFATAHHTPWPQTVRINTHLISVELFRCHLT